MPRSSSSWNFRNDKPFWHFPYGAVYVQRVRKGSEVPDQPMSHLQATCGAFARDQSQQQRWRATAAADTTTATTSFNRASAPTARVASVIAFELHTYNIHYLMSGLLPPYIQELPLNKWKTGRRHVRVFSICEHKSLLRAVACKLALQCWVCCTTIM